MTRGTGTEDKDGTIQWEFQETNPVTKSYETTWGVAKDLPDGRQQMEFWRNGPDGKRYKMMQIVYTKQK